MRINFVFGTSKFIDVSKLKNIINKNKLKDLLELHIYKIGNRYHEL